MHIYKHTNIHIYIHTYIYIHSYIHSYIHIYIYTHKQTYIHMYLRIVIYVKLLGDSFLGHNLRFIQTATHFISVHLQSNLVKNYYERKTCRSG